MFKMIGNKQEQKINQELEKLKQKELKLIHKKRVEKSKELKDVKNSVVVDITRKFFGVISSDKELYYAVMQKPTNQKYMCDCKDFSIQIDKNPNHECKHIIRLINAIKNKEKIPVMDLHKLNLLKGESL